jgi:hypothetical protein
MGVIKVVTYYVRMHECTGTGTCYVVRVPCLVVPVCMHGLFFDTWRLV